MKVSFGWRNPRSCPIPRDADFFIEAKSDPIKGTGDPSDEDGRLVSSVDITNVQLLQNPFWV